MPSTKRTLSHPAQGPGPRHGRGRRISVRLRERRRRSTPARANLNPLLSTATRRRQLSLTTEVRIFPGSRKRRSSAPKIDKMRQQAARFGTEYITGEAKAADLSRRPFRLTNRRHGDLLTRPHHRDRRVRAHARLESEKPASSARSVDLRHTATASSSRQGDAVVRRGDSAMEESGFLSKSRRGDIVHRRDTPAGLEDHSGPRIASGKPGKSPPRRETQLPPASVASTGAASGWRARRRRRRQSRAAGPEDDDVLGRDASRPLRRMTQGSSSKHRSLPRRRRRGPSRAVQFVWGRTS